MTRKVTLLLLALFAVHFASLAQNCGFDAKQAQMMATDPAYAARVADFEAKWANYVSTRPPATGAIKIKTTLTDSVYEIPVAVHVIHTGGAVGTALNPSDADIISYIDYINQSFAATWSGYPSATTGGVKVPFKFVLAKRDTACFTATGIDRVNGASRLPNYSVGGINYLTTGGETELAVKNLVRWAPSLYYNIWIVNLIDAATTTTVFAQPPTVGPDLDGLVVLASEVTGGGNSTKFAVVHELGHAFNLLHVFEGDGTGTTCPPTTNCATTGDKICDTDPVKRSNYSCITSGTNPCTGTGYNGVTQNFMDFSSCSDRFTAGQRQRMMYAFKSIASRAGYLTSLGATEPSGTSMPTACTVNSGIPTNTYNIGAKIVVIADPFSMSASARDTFMYVKTKGYNGDGDQVYVDYTCRHRVQLTVGRSYSITASDPDNTTAKLRAWIDFNNNGTFETTESITLNGIGSTPMPKYGTIAVPSSAVKCTPLRMRIAADNGSSTFGACGTITYGQAEDFTVYVNGTGAPVNATAAINNPPIGGNPSCFNSTLKFFVTHNTGYTVTGIKWYKNNVAIPGATTDTLTTNATTINPGNGDIIKARIFFISPCGQDSAVTNSDTVRRAAVVPPSVDISLTSGAIPGCVDDTLVFNVTNTTNPGGAPTYRWFINNVAVSGATTPTFKTYGNPTGSVVSVELTSSSSCAFPTKDTSNSFTISYAQKPPTVSIALTTGTNPGCAGLPVTITAKPVAGGTAPAYVWYVNGTVEPGATSNTLTKVFSNGDQVYAVLTSNSLCASVPTATSNTITIIQQKITASLTIDVTTQLPICEGKSILFTATPVNGGTNPNPTYQWKVNGANVGGPQGPTASLVIKNKDQVSAILIAGDPCVSNPADTSDTLTVDATPSSIPTLNVKITKGKNPGCLDSLVELTANLADLGNNPDYTWYVNGFPAATGSIFSSSSLLDGDIIRLRANQTDGGCYIPDTIYAKADTMVRSITLDPPTIHLIGNLIHTDRQGTFAWITPSGLDSGAHGETYSPGKIGPYYAVTDNRGCWSRPSNILDITLLDINTTELVNAVKIYPNPTSGKLNMDWNGKLINADITIFNQYGQSVLTEKVRNASSKTINLDGFAEGDYFIVIKDDHNKSGTVNIALHK